MTASTGSVPGRIFMSYRREDTAFPAGWLYDRLASHFGRDQVFKDIDSIELGDDFIEVITTAVGSCDVLLALIGGRWLTITGQDGRRRLDNPDDFVRLEIEAALARHVRVIPILVDAAQMPRAGELPPSLAKLVRRQALELSPNRFDTDIGRLLRVLDRTIAEARDQARRDAEEAAARQGQVEQLQEGLRERVAAGDWQAVLAASEELAVLDPAAADPDGLASAAREQLTRRQEAEEAAAAQRAEVDRLQEGLRERAAAGDWQAVLAASEELAVLDPAAADPDGLASAAREQLTRHQEAEPTAGETQPADDQLNGLGEPPQETAEAQELDLTDQVGAGPAAGPAVTGVAEPGRAEEPAPATGLRLAGHAISRRLAVIGAAAGIAVIGLATAIIIAVNGANLPHGTQLWAYTTGGGVYSSPAVADGIVYVGGDYKVYALDAATGHVRWAHTTGGAVKSSPAVAAGIVYVGSADHKVYALDAATGHVRWTYTTGNHVDSSPAVAAGTVYVGSDDHKVYALDAATGHVRWTYTTGSSVETKPAVAGGTVYVNVSSAMGDGKVYALDAATGHVRWTYTTEDIYDSSPAVAGGTVYVGIGWRLYALDAASGRVRWTYTTGNQVESSPAVAGGTVYVGSDDQKVYALDAATGQVRWTYTTGNQVDSSPAVAGGTVYVGCGDTNVYALDAATGHVRWTYTTGAGVESSPAVAGGTVYVGSGDTNVYALKTTASLRLPHRRDQQTPTMRTGDAIAAQAGRRRISGARRLPSLCQIRAQTRRPYVFAPVTALRGKV
jgi:outer membrane protein assembly factor BamB